MKDPDETKLADRTGPTRLPDNTIQDIRHSNEPGVPVEARLVLDGVSVLYKAPAPPLINPNQDVISFPEDEDINAFIERVKGASPMRRSDTSSASLPFSWFSSRSSVDVEEAEGAEPISFQSDDYAPQIMTEEYVASPHLTSTDCSSGSSSAAAFYSTFVPDRDLDSAEADALNLDEVAIVENEYTILEATSEPDQSENDYESFQGEPFLRAWKSNSGLTDIKAFWETRVSANSNQKVKYASDSNICDNLTALENGLRNIPKVKEFSSAEESVSSSEPSGFEDHIYARIDEIQPQVPRYPTLGFEESGFFSYENHRYYDNVIPEEPSDFEEENTEDEVGEDVLGEVEDSDNYYWRRPNLAEAWSEPRHINLISVTQKHQSYAMASAASIYPSPREDSAVVDDIDASRTPKNQSSFVQKHVTLITIDDNHANPTNPRDLDFSFKGSHGSEPPTFGSVKDLARAFESGPLTPGIRGPGTEQMVI